MGELAKATEQCLSQDLNAKPDWGFLCAEDLTRALSTLGKRFTLSYSSPGVCFVLFCLRWLFKPELVLKCNFLPLPSECGDPGCATTCLL